MIYIVIGISFILVWLVTVLFIVRYLKTLKNDLLKTLSDTEKPSEGKSGYIPNKDERTNFKPFDFVKRVDLEYFSCFLQQEHTQVIALVLAYMEPDKASVVLQNLPYVIQGEVSLRIATMDTVNPEVTREIGRILEKKLFSLSSENYFAAGGIESIVKIIKTANRDSRNHILKAIEEEDADITVEIKKRLKELKNPYKKFCKIFKGTSKN
ncbi:flagellar motor switch protein FliG [Treponema sp. R8-4-B8]